MTNFQRLNWPAIIASINGAGVTDYKLAQMLGVQVFQVKRWKRGSEPKHFLGARILVIYAEYCPEELQDRPKIKV